MRHLSISSFSRRYGVLFTLVACWLFLLEGFFRIPAVQERLKPFEQEPLWYTPYVADRIKLAQDNPNADIWFIGSSVVMRGVNPAEIDPLLNNMPGYRHQSLNIGLPAMVNGDYLREYLADVFLPIGQPRTMVLGVFPHLFAYLTKDFVALGGDLTRNVSMQPDRQVSWWFYQNLALYRYSHALRYAFFQTLPEHVTSDATGYLPIDQSILDTDFPPRIIEPLGEGNDILDESLTRVKFLRDFLLTRNIQLLLLNFPVYDTLVEGYPGGAGRFREYQERLVNFAQIEAIPYRDLHQLIREREGDVPLAAYFGDYYHLNRRGAIAVAPLIAEFLIQNMDSDSISNQSACGVVDG